MSTAGESAEQLRNQEGPQRAGFVELLFDVVLVFAFTRLSDRLVHNLNWSGFYTSVLLTLALWWVWYRLAWTANRYDPARPAIMLMVILTMLGVLLMAAAVPTAFTETGAVFASVYLAIEVLRHLWLVLLGGDRYARLVSVRVLFWACLSAVPWVAGIFTDRLTRLALWTVAVAVDYLGGLLDFPTPRLGVAGLRRQAVAQEHLTERYRQVLIIALGETILSSGIVFSPYAFDRDRTAALLVVFAITVLLWQIYFYRAGTVLPTAIAVSRAPVYIGNLASYAHLVMVLGVVFSSVGDTLVISRPLGHTPVVWIVVIFGGPALFLVGRGLLDWVVFSHVSWSRPFGLLLLGVLAPVALWLPPFMAAVVVAVVLAAIATSNAIAWRWYPREPTPPATRLP